MHGIEIDEELHEFLRQRVQFGEHANDVIRRLLGLGRNGAGKGPAQPPRPAHPPNQQLAAFLESPEFLVCGTAVARFLTILSWLCRQSPANFTELLSQFGRKRKYFGKTREELEGHGSSVMPAQIPRTAFWVVTNTSTRMKRVILERAMRTLKYDPASIAMAVSAIR